MEKIIKKLGHGRYVSPKFPYVHNMITGDDDQIKENNQDAVKDVSHGQHVSGIIAANGQPDNKNGEYVVGVAPEAQLLFLKYFSDDGTTGDVAEAIYDAVNAGADVIALSLNSAPNVPNLNNADQRAIRYAVDHGVVISVSASNDGNSASIDASNNVSDKDDYYPNSNLGNYKPFNSGDIGDPADSPDAITVAAEKSEQDEDSNMADFTSWGPLPDYTLKPDVSAPGVDIISTGNDNKYVKMDGTSMATPFNSGVAALVIQRLKKTNPNLRGAALVQAVKGLIMSTANPQLDVNSDNSAIVSPRRQGAGQINAGAATSSPVYITADDGTSSLSLHNIQDSTNFNLTFHNLSDKEQTYTFDDLGGGYTEDRDPDTGLFSDVQLAGARVDGENSITIAPNSTAKFAYTLKLTGLQKNQLVEGYLHFAGNNGQVDLFVPYLGYYGDMTNEHVFDKNANEDDTDILGNRLTNEDNYPRGIADEYSLKQFVKQKKQDNADYKWQQAAQVYDSGKVAFSPNDDNESDYVLPFMYLKQKIKDLKIEVLNDKGEVIRVVTDAKDVAKSYYDNHSSETTVSTDEYKWDGKVYNKKTGKMEVAPDGQYTYRFIATLYNKGPHQVQTHDMPIIIDTTKPVFKSFNYDTQTNTLTGSYEDTGVGFTDYSYGTVTINDKVFGFKLNEGQNQFDNDDKTKGHFTVKLDAEELAALANTQNKITIAVSDAADNTASETRNIAPVAGKAEVSVWNAITGMPFDTNSADYHENKKVDTYTLRGAANHNFYINGKLVQVVNGQYAVPIDVTSGKIVFTSDEAGKNELYTFKVTDVDPDSPAAETNDSDDSDNSNPGKIDSEDLGNISFDHFEKNEIDFTNIDDAKEDGYDPLTGNWNVTGSVDPDKVASLIAVVQGNSENDPANLIKFDKDGNFKFTFKEPKTGQKAIQYIYTTKDGEKYRGVIGAIVDFETTTLNVELPTITNQPVLHILGTANDNMSGYSVIIDGNNIFTQRNTRQVNSYPESGQSLNPYGPYNINYDVNLDDNNGQPSDHIITIKVVDQVGNVTKKKFNVHYDPNYTGQPEITSGIDMPTTSEQPISKPRVVIPTNNSSDTEVSTDTITLILTHNAFVYDGDGNVVITDGKNTLLEKGNTISAWHKGQITTLAGKKYVQVGDNKYVKLFNTLLKKHVVHNSYLYDANGKATGKKHKLTVVKHGKFVYVWNNGEEFRINGKKFCRLANGKFIKVANLQTVKAIKIKHYRARLYDKNGKLLKKHITLTKGKCYWAWNDAKIVKIHGKKYYRVGKNRYVRANKAAKVEIKTALDADKLK